MKDVIYMNRLYDFYGNLLTEKQKEYFEDYYFNNLTLSEISENNNVSKTAAHKNLKDLEKKLIQYEEKLKFSEKTEKILNLINDLELKQRIKEII